MPPVALLGAGGFLGTHVQRGLTAAGHEVVVLRRATPLRDQLHAAGPAAVVVLVPGHSTVRGRSWRQAICTSSRSSWTR